MSFPLSWVTISPCWKTSLQKQAVASIDLVSEDEITRLYKRFIKLDKDGSGSLDKDEFMAIPQIASNPLAHRLLAVFDADGSGDVDFKEFLVGLSAFSVKGKQEDKLRCRII